MQRRNRAGCRLGQEGRKQTIITTVEPRRRKSQLQLQHRGACRAVNANQHMAFFNSTIRSLLVASFPPSRPCLLALSLLFGLDSDSFVIEPIRQRQHCTSFQFRCISLLCFSASLCIRKPEGLLPTFNPQPTTLISPVLRTCKKDNKNWYWKMRLNGRRCKVMCSDSFIRASTDLTLEGGGVAGWCLQRCILDNSNCEGNLYLFDSPFEINCFFQHSIERPAFEAGERVLAAKVSND